MPDFRRDVKFGKDGHFHDVRLIPGSNITIIDGVQQRVLANPAIGCRIAVDAESRPFTIYPTYGWQILLRPDGTEKQFGGDGTPFGGNYGLAALRQMEKDCEVYLRGPHDGAGGCLIHVFDVEGNEIRTQPALYSGNGILQIDDLTGEVTMVDHPPTVSIGGVLYHYHQVQAGWQSGQLDVSLPEGSLGVVKPDGSSWVTWPVYNNQPSYLAANGSEFRLAIQGVNSPEPSQVVLTRRPGDVVVPPIDPPPSTGRVITISGALNPGDVIRIV